MTMQNLWRPLGLCALAAVLCVGVPVQAHADNFRMEPGTQLVARNDQQANKSKSVDAHGNYKKDAKAEKNKAKGDSRRKAKKGDKADARHGSVKGKHAKGAPKAEKNGAYIKHDARKDNRAQQTARPAGNKSHRGDKTVHPGGKTDSGHKAARSGERPAKRHEVRPEGQRRAQQHNDGDVTN